MGYARPAVCAQPGRFIINLSSANTPRSYTATLFTMSKTGSMYVMSAERAMPD
jgi:hypothetical protein